jgi:hypothetical protein
VVRSENGKVSDLRDPGGSDIVRNMDVDRDSNPVMANSPFNEVGVIEIKGPTH